MKKQIKMKKPLIISGKTFVGKVVSDKMAGTIVVSANQTYKHPLYKKIVSKKHKFYVDDSQHAKLGDTVSIIETKPLSKTKKFKTLEIIKKI